MRASVGVAATDADDRDRILVVTLPRRGVPTLYRTLGDLFVLLCGVYLATMLLWVGVRRRARRTRPAAQSSATPA